MRDIDIGGNIVVDMREANPVPQKIQDFKVAKIRAFMTRFPQRTVVLVGDSSERDPAALPPLTFVAGGNPVR